MSIDLMYLITKMEKEGRITAEQASEITVIAVSNEFASLKENFFGQKILSY